MSNSVVTRRSSDHRIKDDALKIDLRKVRGSGSLTHRGNDGFIKWNQTDGGQQRTGRSFDSVLRWSPRFTKGVTQPDQKAASCLELLKLNFVSQPGPQDKFCRYLNYPQRKPCSSHCDTSQDTNNQWTEPLLINKNQRVKTRDFYFEVYKRSLNFERLAEKHIINSETQRQWNEALWLKSVWELKENETQMRSELFLNFLTWTKYQHRE